MHPLYNWLCDGRVRKAWFQIQVGFEACKRSSIRAPSVHSRGKLCGWLPSAKAVHFFFSPDSYLLIFFFASQMSTASLLHSSYLWQRFEEEDKKDSRSSDHVHQQSQVQYRKNAWSIRGTQDIVIIWTRFSTLVNLKYLSNETFIICGRYNNKLQPFTFLDLHINT